MKYAFLIYDDEKTWQNITAADGQKVMAEYMAYTRALKEAGVHLGGAPLQPTRTATSVRERAGKTLTTDGPFAETKEQLGGFYLVELPDLDEALRWAARCPGARYGTVEVRPVMAIPGAP